MSKVAADRVRAWVARRKRPFRASDVQIPGVIKPHVSRTLSHLARMGVITAVRREQSKMGGGQPRRQEVLWGKV